MRFDPAALNNSMLILVGFGAAFVVALWVSLIIWTFHDIRSRSRDALVRILAVLVSAILFLPGVVIYMLLRPRTTLEYEYSRALEDEALLRRIEENPLCPGCGRRIEADWLVCPGCHVILKKPCVACGRPLQFSWDICPYCSREVEGVRGVDGEPSPHILL